MPEFQVNFRKTTGPRSLAFSKPVHFLFLVVFNLQTIVQGKEFCFDGSKEGYFLASDVIKTVYAQSGVDCIAQCMLQDKSCRSVNFNRKSVNSDRGNCELLYGIETRENPELLHENENYDHYVLLHPSRKVQDEIPPSTTSNTTQFLPTTTKEKDNLKEDTTQQTATTTKTEDSTEDTTTQKPKSPTKKQTESTTRPATRTPKTTKALGRRTPPPIVRAGRRKRTNRNLREIGQRQLQTTQKTTSKDQTVRRASSCKELLGKNNKLPSGTYELEKKISGVNSAYSVYCYMKELGECGGGGWTLVLKMDGDKKTFEYSSTYWKNKKVYKLDNGLKGLTKDESLLASYWNNKFTKICFGMEVKGKKVWMKMHYSGNSLHEVISDNQFRKTTISKNKWKSLMKSAKLQSECNENGFNIKCLGFKARIGIIANNENNCNSCDSWLGFGLWSDQKCNKKSSVTCGNAWMCPARDRHEIAAFGYILIM